MEASEEIMEVIYVTSDARQHCGTHKKKARWGSIRR